LGVGGIGKGFGVPTVEGGVEFFSVASLGGAGLLGFDTAEFKGTRREAQRKDEEG